MSNSKDFIVTFDADSTTAQAKNEALPGCIYFTTDHDIVLGGEVFSGSGSGSMSSAEIINELTDKPLVSPVITDIAASVGSVGGNIVKCEYGQSPNITFKWKWTAADDKKNPTSVEGLDNTLPASGVSRDGSANVASPAVTAADASRVLKLTLMANRVGAMISDNKIVPATGQDSTSASITVKYEGRIYYGNTSTETVAESQLVNSVLQPYSTMKNGWSHQVEENDKNSYYFIAYPSGWGDIKSIKLNGANDETSVWNKQSSTITKSGITYNVYRAANKGGYMSGEPTLIFTV